jgi:hypothetical protein
MAFSLCRTPRRNSIADIAVVLNEIRAVLCNVLASRMCGDGLKSKGLQQFLSGQRNIRDAEAAGSNTVILTES